MKTRLFIFVTALIIAFTSTVNLAYAQKTHKIAILPYIPTFSGSQIKKTDEITLAKMMETDAYSAQKTMYQIMQANKADFSSEIQDYNETNKLLKENGIEYHNIADKSINELCAILGVDMLVCGKLEKKIKSLGVDITLGVLGSTVRYICGVYKKDTTEVLKEYNVLWKIGVAGKYDSDKMYTKIGKAAYKKIKGKL